MWHFQVNWNWKVTWTYNDFHKGLPYGWFAVCEFRPFRKMYNQNKSGN